MELDIHKDQFRRIFELPIIGIYYTLDKPLGIKNFKHSTTFDTLFINPMEKKKVPFKPVHLKPTVRILHYLITRILCPRIINNRYVIREYIVPLWLLTQKITTNWVEGMINHMIWCKEIPSVGLPYEPIITRLIAIFNIDTMEKNTQEGGGVYTQKLNSLLNQQVEILNKVQTLISE